MCNTRNPQKKRRLKERLAPGPTSSSGVMPDPAPAAASPAAASASTRTGRPWTVTLALPGSIVDNAQSHELRSYLVGQVARACAIFNVDEIVVFQGAKPIPPPTGEKQKTDGSVFMLRLLQYAAMLDMPVITHAEDAALVGEAVATAGEYATRRGLPSDKQAP